MCSSFSRMRNATQSPDIVNLAIHHSSHRIAYPSHAREHHHLMFRVVPRCCGLRYTLSQTSAAVPLVDGVRVLAVGRSLVTSLYIRYTKRGYIPGYTCTGTASWSISPSASASASPLPLMSRTVNIGSSTSARASSLSSTSSGPIAACVSRMISHLS